VKRYKMKSPKKLSLTKLSVAGILALSVSGTALASSYECDSGPKSEWKTKDEAKAVVLAEGYEIRKIKAKGGCYEIYARKNGERMEIFLNPSNLEIVKIKED
jgi:hypothetical protein